MNAFLKKKNLWELKKKNHHTTFEIQLFLQHQKKERKEAKWGNDYEAEDETIYDVVCVFSDLEWEQIKTGMSEFYFYYSFAKQKNQPFLPLEMCTNKSCSIVFCFSKKAFFLEAQSRLLLLLLLLSLLNNSLLLFVVYPKRYPAVVKHIIHTNNTIKIYIKPWFEHSYYDFSWSWNVKRVVYSKCGVI